MEPDESNTETNRITSGKLRALKALSNQIVQRANTGIPRVQFFREVSQMLLNFTGCDIIRIVLVERGRRYRCEATSASQDAFRFEVAPGFDVASGMKWSTGTGDAFEQLCHDIVADRVDHSQPWITENGSLWTGDVSSLEMEAVVDADPGGELCIGIDSDCRSVALIPIDIGEERVGLLEVEARRADFFTTREVEDYERLAQTFGISIAQRRLQVALRERVKELTCLYGIAKLQAQPGIGLKEILQKAAELLPPGWLYPDAAVAQIVVDGETFPTESYRTPVQAMRADVVVAGEHRGFVEVAYVWEQPELDEGPFLREERNLIDTVAGELAIIIEQHQVEREKRRLQEQLRHADRLATIGQLAAGVAHELNEPLSNVLGFAQLATKDTGLSAQTRQDVERIVQAALHAREVIRKLLMFARQTTPERRRIHLNDVIEDGLYFLESRCTKAGIDLIRHLSEYLPPITADPSQLKQVLTNLVVNSVQAMKTGGRLVLSTCVDGDHVVLSVEDSGTGMSEEIQKKIFNPFFTTKDIDQGTGLGLSVVHGIVSAHGGSVSVRSREGKGTVFEVRLPIKAPSQ